MSLKGNLQSVDLANVLQMLSINQKEGTLVLFDGDTRKSIYFSREGVSMLSRGRKGQDSLGRILLRYGVITPEQLQEALGKQQAEGKRLGEVLQEMGAATDGDVENAIRTQIEEEIYNLFIWKEASFEFLEGPPPEAQNVPAQVTFNVNSLIMEAQRRADEWNYIRGLVPSLDEIYKPTEKMAEAQVKDEIFHLPFAPRILENLQQGRLNVHEIIESSCAAKFEACKILAILLEQGTVEPVSIADLQAMAQEAMGRGDQAQAAKFLSRIVDLGGATPPVNMQLGYALEALDEPERASVFLKAAAEAYVEAMEPAHAFEAYIRVARALPTDLPAVTQMVEIACNSEAVLATHRHEVIEAGRTLAQCLRELGRLPAALQILHRLCQAGPQDLPLRNMLVQAYQESGMNNEAMVELEAMAEICNAQKNYDETIRLLRRIVAIDRNRPGASKKIEALTRLRDRGKRFLMRIVAFAGVLLVIGGALYGVSLFLEKKKAEKAAIDRKVADTLDPLRSEFDRFQREFKDRAMVLEGWKDPSYSVESLEKDVKTLSAAIASMEDLARRTELGAQGLLAEFEGRGYPTETLKDTRMSPLRAVLADAKSRRDDLLGRVRQGIEDDYRKRRELADSRPISQIEEIRRIFDQLRAIGIDAPRVQVRDQKEPESVEETIAQLEKYRGDLAKTQEDMDALYGAGKGAEARSLGVGILAKFPSVVEFHERIRFQTRITTVPEKARIRALDAPESDPGTPSPFSLSHTATTGLRFTVAAEGFQPRTLSIPALEKIEPDDLDEALPHEMKVVLLKEPVWTLDVGEGEWGAPPVPTPDGRFAVLADRAGWIHLISLADGRKVQSLDTRCGSGFQGAPVVTSDSVYAASVDGEILALDLPSLAERWRHPVAEGPGPVYGSPVLAGDLLVVAGAGGLVLAFSPGTGARAWEVRLDAGTRRDLVYARNWIVAFCEDGCARTVSLEDRSVIAVLPTDRVIQSLPPPQFGPLAVGDKILLALQGAGREFSFVTLPVPGSASPHVARRWGAALEGAEAVGAVLDGDEILLLFSNGMIRRAALLTGPREGEPPLGPFGSKEAFLGSPLLRDGVLFLTTDRSLLALRLQGSAAREVWNWAAPEGTAISTPVVVIGNLALICTRDRRLLALLKD